eukprot:TRINITY_DN5161_c0_g2_i1.p1 TRINITY_DN5161_c0_g2~~TRINITY_DN5161_c0_g2_i1.p1  ORF type:complete len:896 (+),score=321.41 TRINITY_DN5161_c0_g2_i1:298-2688(+)
MPAPAVAAAGWEGFSPPTAPVAAPAEGTPRGVVAPPLEVRRQDSKTPKRVRFSVGEELAPGSARSGGAPPPGSSRTSVAEAPPPGSSRTSVAEAPPPPQWQSPPVVPATPLVESTPLTLDTGRLGGGGDAAASPSSSVASSASNAAEEGEGEFGQILEGLNCPVCLDTYHEPVTMACGHTLCKEHIFDLAAMLHHPDTGIIEFDCPKCRERCSFPSAKEVKTNFEMKSMITLVLKAAQKTKRERRTERERKLQAQVKMYEAAMAEMQTRERRLEADRERLAADRKKVEDASKTATAANQQQQIAEGDKIAKERKRLEREKLLLTRQKEELAARSTEFLRKKSFGDVGQPAPGSPFSSKPWHKLSLEEKERELDRIKTEQEQERRRQREERDRKIEEGLRDWVSQANHVQQQSLQHRLAGHKNISDMPTDVSPLPESPAAGQGGGSSPSPHQHPNKYSHIRQLPAASPAPQTPGPPQQPAPAQQAAQLQAYHAPPDLGPAEAEPSPQGGGYAAPQGRWGVPTPPVSHGVDEMAATPQPAPQPSSSSSAMDESVFSMTDPAKMLQRRSVPENNSAPPLPPPVPPPVIAPAPLPKPNLDSSVYQGLGPVNPITGFPDPRRQEAVDDAGGADPFRYEADAIRHMQKHNPPTKVPEDYPNYQYGVHDPVDHELHDVLEKVDADHAKALAKAHEKRVLAEKARIAEERALAMVAQYKSNERERRLAGNDGWDKSVKSPSERKSSRGAGAPQAPPKRLPSQTKLARRVPIGEGGGGGARRSLPGPSSGGARAGNPVNVVRRVQ